MVGASKKKCCQTYSINRTDYQKDLSFLRLAFGFKSPSMIERFQNHSLLALNSFQIPVKAKRLIRFDQAADSQEALSERKPGERMMVLGGGSNVLFLKDFDGLILQNCVEEIQVISESSHQVEIAVSAGYDWDRLVAWSIEQGYFGLENLSLIPGTVGASPIQNIGAYGREVKDFISHVEGFNLETEESLSWTNAECRFAYRDSIFKKEWKSKVMITNVVFRLSKVFTPFLEYGNLLQEIPSDEALTADLVRRTVIRIRESKLPDPGLLPNAGSFFKNPVLEKDAASLLLKEYPSIPHFIEFSGRIKIPAAWLIDQCGWKGRRMGKVGVHEKQALVLVNYGESDPQAIVNLAQRIQADVLERFGISLESEVNWVS